ncbi:transcriptional regulator [Gracilibacillus boraciitolerans JCM 21714]|uniref:Transcriptional regulator n=1 Tax=Gracilibacillus boraciitolerans JCM 21714 TaxID=1298598 RepID=W4VGB8_9BACI|nr:hypothetical protein [Gracilibacillus boraciitolerans]GAE91863.1 transcriptional regulator [Gracilibacillus boraciitolerans JCM 21714]
MEQFIWILQKHNGSLFDASIAFYQLIVEEQEHFTFFKNALLNMNAKIEKSVSGIFASEEELDHFKNIYNHLNLSLLKIQTEEEIFQLMKMISAITFYNITEKFSKDFPIEISIKNYQSQLDLLKKGVIR